MARVLKEKIRALEKLAPDIFKMTLESEYVARNAEPGQFINVKCSEGLNALLRRPISICHIDREHGLLDIVFQIKGIGTEYLSQKQVGSEVDIIAPLGKGFQVSKENKRVAVVGGGIGIFPLLYLLNKYGDADKTAYLGFRSKDYIVLKNEFTSAVNKLEISTDDGTEGYKGLVTDLLERDLKESKLDIIFACGPTPMIKKVVELAHKYEVKCQVSLEQRMGCGIGACLVCACKTRLGNEWEYSHVCKDGPVFWSDEVIFDG
jgi:dihydroorotate dehydrogenase electron transfer subunit